jgi:T-complex protein 1 subunit delta
MTEKAGKRGQAGQALGEGQKGKDVRNANITSGKAVAEMVRTSLGPRGMDKMIQDEKGEVSITNDGATIMKQIKVMNPASQMLVDLSAAQDVEAGDGTTTVVVVAGALLNACQLLMDKGIHPTIISEAFQKASDKAEEILIGMAIPVELTDRESLLKSAVTSLSSKLVSQHAGLIGPIAVDAVLRVINPEIHNNVDLRDVRIVKKLGGTIDDTELIDGLIFEQGAATGANGPTELKNAKIGLIQFCLSPPKTDLDNSIIVTDYQQMDRILKEERLYLLNLCKKIKAVGCTLLLVQKSILRDAVNDMALHFLAKLGIMVIKDVERTDIEFICKTVGCLPVASIDNFTAEKLGTATAVSEVSTCDGHVIKVTGVPNPGKTVTVFCRGSNKLILDETERSLHDALCVVRCLVKKKFLIAGGSAPEMEMSLQLGRYAKTLEGSESYCIQAFADALEVVPYTLAENAGLHPIQIVTSLRNKHSNNEKGHQHMGINVRRGDVTDMVEENVLQPLLVTLSAITLATETVRMIMKIDDIVSVR